LYVCDAALAFPIITMGDDAVKLIALSPTPPAHTSRVGVASFIMVACSRFTSRVRRSPVLGALAGAGVTQKG
jgi:hypothetical protein